MLLRFDGTIAGLGTEAGVRLVIGMWRSSPFGPIADVMVELADGHRILVAPSAEVAAFIAGTYRFDEVRVEPVTLRVDGEVHRLRTATLSVDLVTGTRTPLGRLLALVPDRVARSRFWCRLIDPVARLVRHGVRTTGTAGGGRQEWYCATGERRLVSAAATLDGVHLGALRPVVPAVRFGFASTPPRPAAVDVTTWIASPRFAPVSNAPSAPPSAPPSAAARKDA